MPDDDNTNPNPDDDTDDGTDDGTDGGDGGGNEPDLASELAEAKRELRSVRAKLSHAQRAAAAAGKGGGSSDDGKDDTVPKAEIAKLEERAAKAERRAQQAQAESLAAGLNIVDTEAAVRLLDWDSIDDPDDRTQVRDALKQLKKDRPWLAQPVDTGAGGRGTAGGGASSMSDIIRRAAGK